MNKLNENIFHQYNKWKKGYERKENSLQLRLNNFLSDKANVEFTDSCHISKDGKHIDFNTSITIRDVDLIDGKLPFPFGKIDGYFDCAFLDDLVSLEGAPEEVTGDFFCSNCPKLTSLEGAPEKVGGDFCTHLCPNLTSLEHLPKKIGGGLSVDKRFMGKLPSDILVVYY